jgi:hypothetical protein
MKDSDLKFVGSKLWALKGAERRLLGNRAESIPPRQVESPSIPGPRSLLHCFFATKRQRNAGKRFVVRADEKLTAFVELESVIRPCNELS